MMIQNGAVRFFRGFLEAIFPQNLRQVSTATRKSFNEGAVFWWVVFCLLSSWELKKYPPSQMAFVSEDDS